MGCQHNLCQKVDGKEMARREGLKINITQTLTKGQQYYNSKWAVSKNEKKRKPAKNTINKENTTFILCPKPSKRLQQPYS